MAGWRATTPEIDKTKVFDLKIWLKYIAPQEKKNLLNWK